MRLHIFVSGKVQGVFFRDYVLEAAKDNGVFGWVKNLEDGKIEIVVEGNPKDIVKFMAMIKIGSEKSCVEDIEMQEEEDTGELVEFEIK